MTDIVEHHHSSAPMQEPIRIKLEKNTKGYSWEISCNGQTIDQIMAVISAADIRLRDTYGGA